MKKNFILLSFAFFELTALAQTVYVPSGSSGIGTSSTANVGIGVSNPSQKLQVESGNILVRGTSNFATNTSAILYFGNTDHYISGTAAQGIKIGTAGNPDALFLKQYSGFLGIGTGNPVERIHVDGGNILVRGINNFATTGNEAILKLGDNSNYIKAVHGSGIRIGVYNWVGPNDLIYINNTGNVGIGTATTGSCKLAVEGKIGAREVVVAAAPLWPDYVFEKEYKLPSLKEVEDYISDHKHLPNIPSAEDVSQNGIGLGEMNAALLKKIEELTLYMIELEKKNVSSTADIKLLKEELNALKEKKQ